jgi:Tol biopolymer transport system component
LEQSHLVSPRVALLLFVVLLTGLLAAVHPADAGSIGPWHATKDVPFPPAAAPPPGAGLVGGGGRDISGDGRYVASIGGAPDGFAGCVSDACLAYYVIDTQTNDLDPVGVAYDGAPILSLILLPPSISDDGRYVEFADHGIFVFDRQTRQQERADLNTSGAGANPPSTSARISGDGRHVVFISNAGNMGATVQCDTQNCNQVFVRDLDVQATELVSVNTAGDMADGTSLGATINFDGRFVAFSSQAGNLGEGANDVSCLGNQAGVTRNCTDIFVRDRQAGTTTLGSPNSLGNQGNGDSNDPSISDDGTVVAFSSAANNLVPGDGNHATDVFVHDLSHGATERISVTSAGVETDNGSSSNPALSGGGDRVAFESTSTTLDPGGPALCGPSPVTCSDIFVRERAAGLTYKVSVSIGGEHGDARSTDPAISDDGRTIVFVSGADNLVAGVTGGTFLAARDSDFTWGDFDCSGQITALDALHLLQSQLGLFTPLGICPPANIDTIVGGQTHSWADYDCTSDVTPADVAPVLAYVADAPSAGACPALGQPAEPQAG